MAALIEDKRRELSLRPADRDARMFLSDKILRAIEVGRPILAGLKKCVAADAKLNRVQYRDFLSWRGMPNESSIFLFRRAIAAIGLLDETLPINHFDMAAVAFGESPAVKHVNGFGHGETKAPQTWGAPSNFVGRNLRLRPSSA